MRLIDADETRKKMLNSLDELFENVEMTGKMIYQKTLIRTIIHHIDDAQTIDAVPVKHGHWITDDSKIYLKHKCSECGNAVILKYPYCENCGAEMDGGENE